MKKTALITGITGQDGSYLSEFLLEKGYIVHGIKRRSSLFNTDRIDHIYEDFHESSNFFLHYGDLTDTSNLIRIISETQPDEIYNLGAMSHVKVSFDMPEYTAQTDGLGILRILEAIKILNYYNIKIYQAGTSEMFGEVQQIPQNENTPFYPRSPYAASKVYAHHIVKNYREAYNIFACSGILFNHESPRRGETFVTRKITIGVSRIVLGLDDKIYLGNIDAKRDWGHAKDYCKAMWLMLQQEKPEDYVVASGKTNTVREFLIKCFNYFGITLKFEGSGKNEKAYIKDCKGEYQLPIGKCVMEIDPIYYRPTEVNYLLGDSTKAKKELKWKPEYNLIDLINEMIEYDFEKIRNSSLYAKRK